MEQLNLSTRPKSPERDKCYDAGDGLPLWKSLPLYSKFPMLPVPKGTITLCTTKLCEPLYKVNDLEFDLSDPYCHVISNEYQPLHDPHLKNHYNLPRMRRHLRKKGFITERDKVICNLREFNQYRQYLHKMCLLEMAKERKEKEEEERLRKASQEERGGRPESRGCQVRARLHQMREETRKRIQREIEEKEERLKLRLHEIEIRKKLRDNQRRQLLQRRHAAVAEYHDKMMRENMMLNRQWRQKERLRQLRLEEYKRKRQLSKQKRDFEMWNSRRAEQFERIAAAEEARKAEEVRREKSMAERDQKFTKHREKLQAHLEEIQRQSRSERDKTEREHTERLTRRLAMVKHRMARARRGRRSRCRYESLWALEDILREMATSDLHFSGRESTDQFLRMLNEALDAEIKKLGEDEPGYDNEEDIITKAREIVDSVIHRVKTEVYPVYVQMRREEQKSTVRFGKDDSIPPNRAVDRTKLRPVSDHVLTPISTPCVIGKVISTEKCSEMKLVESLLNRLLDDLNRGRLTEEEVNLLTGYAMDVVYNRIKGVGVGYDMGKIAESVVEFTLEKILNDIRSNNVPHEEVTEMAALMIGKRMESDASDISISSDDDQLQMFIDDTLESIINDTGRESPQHDAILEEWIMNTLKEISDDINHDRLSKGVVAEMVSMMTTHEDSGDIQVVALRPFLEKVIEEIGEEQNTPLYKVVHAIVSAYHAYKIAALESFSQLIRLLIERLNQANMDSELKDSDIDLNILQDAAEKLSLSALSKVRIRDMATSIAKVFRGHEYTTTSSQLVDDVIEKAKSLVTNSDFPTLKGYAKAMSEALETLLIVIQEEEKSCQVDPNYLSKVNDLVVNILKVVENGLESDGFTADDVQDMTRIFTTIVSRSVSPTKECSREKMLITHISDLLGTLESGQLDPQEVLHLGSALIECGNRLLLGHEAVDSSILSKEPSLTSSAVDSDVLSHILYSIQDEMNKGLITKNAIKELALCILNTRASEGFYEKKVKNSLDDRSSPTSAAKLEFAKETLREMLSDFELGNVDMDKTTSVALSVVSELSDGFCGEHKDTTERIADTIIQLLQRDEVTKSDTKRIFSIVLQRLVSGIEETHADDQVKAIDSNLANCVVEEVLRKIERDITSGRLSGGDILCVVDDSKEERISALKGHCDIVNLTLAVMQQFLLDMNTKKATKEFVQQFLSSALQMDIPSDETVPMLRMRVRDIMKEIRKNKLQSVHIKRFVHAFSSKLLGKDDETSKNEAVALLKQAVQNVHPSIMSDFIRLTLQTLVSDCTYYQREEMETEQQGYVLRSMSSLVADRVVDNLLHTIEHAIREERPAQSADHLAVDNYLLSRSDLSCIPSEDLNAIITGTLNSIISSMRLEKPVETKKDHPIEATSQIIHNFVLEKLQDIVDSMQDSLEEGDAFTRTSILKRSSSTVIEGAGVKKVISDTFRSVVGDISTEPGRVKSNHAEQSTSTASLEAEAIVVEALQGIIQHYEERGVDMSHDQLIKEHMLCILENFKKDIYTNKAVHDSLQNIFNSFIVPVASSHIENEEMESAIDVIIENVKCSSIPVADVPNVKDGKPDNQRESSIQLIMERPGLDLQKMTEMTQEMAYLYDNFQSSEEEIDNGESNHSLNERVASEVKTIAKEVLEKTIDNVQHNKLSNDELLTLASAISANEGEVPMTQLQYSESKIEDMIVEVLQNTVEDLRESGINQEDLPIITKNMFQVKANNGGKETTANTSTSDVSHAPSGAIVEMVTSVLSKIAANLSEESVKFTKVQRSDECVQQSACDQLDQVGVEQGNSSQDNMNPNALKLPTVRSLEDNAGPSKRTTPTPVVQSAHDIRHKTPHQSGKSKDKSDRNVPKRGTSKPLAQTPKQTQRQKATHKAYRPPFPKESKPHIIKSVKGGVSPKSGTEKVKQGNLAVIKPRRSHEKNLLPCNAENETFTNQLEESAAKDLPQQVYSLWGSFKLAVKSVYETS